MKTLKDHQDTMVSMLASDTAIPTSAIRLAHALHDVLAHLNNTNAAPVAHTERRIDATTPGLNDAMLAQDIASVKPKQQSLESLLKQRDNTIRQLKGRVAEVVGERDWLKARLEEALNLTNQANADSFEPEQAGCRKQDTQVADDGWIEWAGGECPVDSEVAVEIKFRNGAAGGVTQQRAITYRWTDEGSDWDIIAYRVVKP